MKSLIKETRDTQILFNEIKKQIRLKGKKETLDEIMKSFTPYANEYNDCFRRVENFIDSLDSCQEQHPNEMARAIVKALIKKEEYRKLNLARDTLYSNNSSSLWNYDPVKNGINIFKHGIDFNSISSICEINSPTLISHSKVDGEVRNVVLRKLKGEEAFLVEISTSQNGTRYITAWRFYPSNYKGTIESRIADPTLQKEVRNHLKERTVEVFERFFINT